METTREFLCLNIFCFTQFVSLCHFLLDLGLPDMQVTTFPPSIRACAALHLGQLIWAEMTELEEEEEDLWTPSLRKCTTYTVTELRPCMRRLARLLYKMEKSKYQVNIIKVKQG